MIVAFAVATSLIVALRPVATAIGLVDKPGGRKRHQGDIPIIGGLGMYAGLFAGLIIAPNALDSVATLFAACSILVIVGVVDDRFHVPTYVRFAAQIAVVLIMVYGAGLPLASIGDPFGAGEIQMGRFTLIFTTLVTLSMINAYNMIDGIDGLAGTLAMITLVSVAIVGGAGSAAAAIALTAVAAIVGFLIFNWPIEANREVKTFMGDAGSTMLGLVVVWATLTAINGSATPISPVHCLWFAAVPIYDLFTCFVRRALSGKSPLEPARDHFHHTLRRGSMRTWQVLVTLGGLQLLYSVIGLTAHFASVPDVTMFMLWAFMGFTQWWVIKRTAMRSRVAVLRSRSL
jgi:UDP-GlcNAc:undecaprenyl-phosphate GlcNAc-1-phosphate transferase